MNARARTTITLTIATETTIPTKNATIEAIFKPSDILAWVAAVV